MPESKGAGHRGSDAEPSVESALYASIVAGSAKVDDLKDESRRTLFSEGATMRREVPAPGDKKGGKSVEWGN